MGADCPHHWTVTSECPQCLRAELNDAYAEIRKQVVGSRVVFDRDLVKRAMKAGGETYAEHVE